VFSCTGPTADQQCKLNEREQKQKIACDKDNSKRRKWNDIIQVHTEKEPLGNTSGRWTWSVGPISLCHLAPVQAWDPPDDTTQPYVPEAPVQWIPSYSREMLSEKRDQCIKHKMSQQRRQYPHPKTPNKLLDPLILQQSILSSLETIEARGYLKTWGSVNR